MRTNKIFSSAEFILIKFNWKKHIHTWENPDCANVAGEGVGKPSTHVTWASRDESVWYFCGTSAHWSWSFWKCNHLCCKLHHCFMKFEPSTQVAWAVEPTVSHLQLQPELNLSQRNCPELPIKGSIGEKLGSTSRDDFYIVHASAVEILRRKAKVGSKWVTEARSMIPF